MKIEDRLRVAEAVESLFTCKIESEELCPCIAIYDRYGECLGIWTPEIVQAQALALIRSIADEIDLRGNNGKNEWLFMDAIAKLDIKVLEALKLELIDD